MSTTSFQIEFLGTDENEVNLGIFQVQEAISWTDFFAANEQIKTDL